MTRKEALAEATRRWGPNACVGHNPRRKPPYTVGFVGMGGLAFMVQGEGRTWYQAFKDADRRAVEDLARIARIRAERNQP